MLKKILKALGVLLLLGVIVLTFILVPAHLQIRDVNPELPSNTDLEALAAQADGPTKISYLVTSSQTGPEISIGHTTFVVEWEDGKILLIDVGMDRDVAVEFGELFETIGGSDPAVPNGTIPELLGNDLQRVQGVGFTHLHLDHVQGIEPICAVSDQTISSLHTSDQMTKHNLHTEDQFDLLSQAACVSQQDLADGETISANFPGVGIYPLGGHTPGSTLFAVPVDGKLWLLAGDISNVRSNLTQNKGKGFIYSYLMVPEDVEQTELLRKWFTGLDEQPNMTVIVSHDTKALVASGMNKWGSEAAVERTDPQTVE